MEGITRTSQTRRPTAVERTHGSGVAMVCGRCARAEFDVSSGGRDSGTLLVPAGAQQRFYESHGFTSDDRQFCFRDRARAGRIVHRYYRSSRDGVPSPDLVVAGMHEHAFMSPAGNRIIWMSSRTGRPNSVLTCRRTSLADERRRHRTGRRLTFFNQEGLITSLRVDYRGR